MNILEGIESNAVSVVAQIGPWLAPIPTAFMAYRTGVEVLGWPLPVALAGALALEILGVATTATALMLRDYNAAKRKTDPVAPTRLAYALAGVYLLAAQLVVLFVEVWPGVVRWVPGLFPLVSLTGAVTISLRSDHQRRLAAVRQKAADRSAARRSGGQRKRSGVTDSGQVTGAGAGDPGQSDGGQAVSGRSNGQNVTGQAVSKAAALDRLVEFYGQNPGASYATAARSVDRSKSWVTGAVRQLVTDGRLVKNGQGVEALTD